MVGLCIRGGSNQWIPNLWIMRPLLPCFGKEQQFVACPPLSRDGSMTLLGECVAGTCGRGCGCQATGGHQGPRSLPPDPDPSVSRGGGETSDSSPLKCLPSQTVALPRDRLSIDPLFVASRLPLIGATGIHRLPVICIYEGHWNLYHR